MESKLLVGGKNIVDHTNEQQRILELKRQEIAEQVQFPKTHCRASELDCVSVFKVVSKETGHLSLLIVCDVDILGRWISNGEETNAD